MSFLDCSKAFAVVFLGLVLATAGVCLTLAGWFAPPINDSVKGVRLAGPALLVIGLLVLCLSCLLCAINQELCFQDCVRYCYRRGKLDVTDVYLDDGECEESTVHANLSHAEAQLVLDIEDSTGLTSREILQVLDAYSMVSPNCYVQSPPTTPAQRASRCQRYDTPAPTNQRDDGNQTMCQVMHTPQEKDQSEEATSPWRHRTQQEEETTLSTRSSPAIRRHHPSTMFEGVGVRVKQYSSSHNKYNYAPLDQCETKRLLDPAISSSPPPPPAASHGSARSSPCLVSKLPQQNQSAFPTSNITKIADSQHLQVTSTTTQDSAVISKTSEQSTDVMTLPGPEEQAVGVRTQPDVSWSQRVLAWDTTQSSSNAEPPVTDTRETDKDDPPCYRDMFVIHSDV